MELKKEFAPYQLSVALKELGFDEPCLKISMQNVGIYGEHKDCGFLARPLKNSDGTNIIAHPLLQQAERWFRVNYNLNYPIMENTVDFAVQGSTKFIFCGGTYGANTYEEAELMRLIVLIEIVKRLQFSTHIK